MYKYSFLHRVISDQQKIVYGVISAYQHVEAIVIPNWKRIVQWTIQ